MKRSKTSQLLTSSAFFPWPGKNICRLARLMKTTVKKTPGFGQLAPILETDRQFLLDVFNSSYYAPGKKIRTLKALIELVKVPDILNVLFLKWLSELVPAGRHDVFDYKREKGAWLLNGFLAQNLSRALKFKEPEGIFFQSCFQDISLLFLARCHPQLLHRLSELPGDYSRLESEEMVALGFSHSELSGAILERIGFSPRFTRPVRRHHQVWLGETELQNADPGALIISTAAMLVGALTGSHRPVPMAAISQKLKDKFNAEKIPILNILQKSIAQSKAFATVTGFPLATDYSLVRLLLKDHKKLEKSLIPYRELVAETCDVYEKIAALEKENRQLKKQLEENQLWDSLTGLLSFSHFRRRLEEELSRAARHEYPVSLLIFDLRDFTLFNRTYGLEAGDDILRQLGKVFRNQLRETDLVGRVGGDEVAVLLPFTGQFQARIVAEKLKRAIHRLHFGDPTRARRHQIYVDYTMNSLLPGALKLHRLNFFESALAQLSKSHQEDVSTPALAD